MTAPNATPPAPPAKESSDKNMMAVILLGCGGVAVLLALVMGGLFVGYIHRHHHPPRIFGHW